MRIQSIYFPPDIISIYHIDEIIAEDGYVYIKIIKRMYGLKQSSIMSSNKIILTWSHTDNYRYPSKLDYRPKKNRGTKKFLCGDDFRVRYFNKDDADHLLQTLKNHCTILTDREGGSYLGLTIYWNYNGEYVDISMSRYVKKSFDRFQYPKPKNP